MGRLFREDVSGQFDNLLTGKKTRIDLIAHVYCGVKVAATFKGSYVVLPKIK